MKVNANPVLVLFGVELRYANQQTKPVLCQVNVLRETEKLYILQEHFPFLGYISRIAKDSNRVFTTPAQAWNNYLDKVSKQTANLRNYVQNNVEVMAVAQAALDALKEVK